MLKNAVQSFAVKKNRLLGVLVKSTETEETEKKVFTGMRALFFVELIYKLNNYDNRG